MYTYNVKGELQHDAAGHAPASAGAIDAANVSPWTPLQRVVFRIAFIFFLILIVPWHPDFYRQLFSIHWLSPHFKNLLDLITFLPQVVSISLWGSASFVSWAIYLAAAIAGAVVWTLVDKQTTHYTFLDYVLRASIRYKLGLSLLACGFFLFFQQQMPYPSLSNLHTNYGDMFAWKLYYQTTAINPEYQSFLGFVEIVAGILVLYRKTVTFGTGLVLGFLGNVAMVNLFYDVGHHLLVNFLLLSSVYLFAHDVPRLYSLLVKGVRTSGSRYYPVWRDTAFYWVRKIGRPVAIVLILLTGFRAYVLVDNPYKVPQQAGIPGSYGYYIPTVFKLNDKVIEYSTTDPNRWQDVIFEKWSTVSFRINQPVAADITEGDKPSDNDLDRTYELAGSNARHYFHYTIDPGGQQISLQNKHPDLRDQTWTLRYSFPTDSTLILEGTNQRNEQVYAELLRIHKKYFMYEGRRSRIKL